LAEINTIQAKVEEIRSWYKYRKHFEKRLDDLPENKRNDKRACDLASGGIYDKMLQYLSGISRASLRKRTQRTKPIYKLFSAIGEDKISRIKSYSANKLSKLTDKQIDIIINHYTTKILVRDQKSRTHVTESTLKSGFNLSDNKNHTTKPSSLKDVSNIEA
ncbi:20562_t:CDS:1, partial [Racocetra persica]